MSGRSIRTFLALGLISLVGLVHCSSAESRAGFVDQTKKPATTVDSTDPTDDDDDTGGFDTDAPTPKGDDTVCTQDIDVVLVLDVSSSMGFVLTKLGSEI